MTCTCGYDDTIATRIEALEAENARLREAVQWFARLENWLNGEPSSVDELLLGVTTHARAALKGDD